MKLLSVIEEVILEQQSLNLKGKTIAPGISAKHSSSTPENNNPHALYEVLGIATIIIPYIGPLLSSGFGLLDAELYYKEGDTKTAALVGAFALLPGFGAVVSKIPGVKQLGVKGMSLLASKISKGKKITSSLEILVINEINRYKDLVKSALENHIKPLIKKIGTKPVGLIKRGVAELFKEYPQLSKIGTPEQYSKYLNTVFPESEAKDIVYHGTNHTFDTFKGYFTSFIDNKDFAEMWAKDRWSFRGQGTPKVYSAKVNINTNKMSSGSINKYGNEGVVTGYEYRVVGDENILMLGSKKDLDGFKNFVLGNK
jgi:hypothetical protein